MESGAIGSVADMFVPSPKDLAPEDRLGRYEIVRLLGEGGMGKFTLLTISISQTGRDQGPPHDLWWYKQAETAPASRSPSRRPPRPSEYLFHL